jgi:hypothetical protein|tara:strand:- start:2468 stop:2923 length:456 start_codon:yes stop_codon:yes gene_type:complete
MKLDQLRNVIREEVRAAVKEELQDMLTEAVKIASSPRQSFGTAQPTVVPTTTEVAKPSRMNPVMTANKGSLDEMLQMTRENMTQDDYKSVINADSSMVSGMPNMASSMVNKMNMNAGNQPGLDISSLDFVKKAGQVFKAAEIKDKEKAGIV